MSASHEAIYRAVQNIPRGRVMTYGQVANAAGFGRHARLVGYALSALGERAAPEGDVPWHRVINGKGQISVQHSAEEQATMLQEEGVVVSPSHTVDLSRFRVGADTASPADPLSAGHVAAMLKKLGRKDPNLRRALKRLGPPPYTKRPLSFSGLLRIVVGQQLSGKAAETIYRRLEAALDGKATPDRYLRASVDALRSCGLSKQKERSGRALAKAVQSKTLRLRALHRKDDAAVAEDLTVLPGFGPWSAHMALLFLLGRPDVWPTGDLGVQHGIAEILDLPERPSKEALEELGARWKPYRSAVALLAWRAANNR